MYLVLDHLRPKVTDLLCGHVIGSVAVCLWHSGKEGSRADHHLLVSWKRWWELLDNLGQPKQVVRVNWKDPAEHPALTCRSIIKSHFRKNSWKPLLQRQLLRAVVRWSLVTRFLELARVCELNWSWAITACNQDAEALLTKPNFHLIGISTIYVGFKIENLTYNNNTTSIHSSALFLLTQRCLENFCVVSVPI